MLELEASNHEPLSSSLPGIAVDLAADQLPPQRQALGL